ncbi:hypothetical protein ACCO45_012661 [Purpureocillium lilacinum]|uniref:Uncharacterized protein n=1 Tax=Purpureocillium lilacinum TaxID=33203 RepID=A0ACC4DBQ4_PURLI
MNGDVCLTASEPRPSSAGDQHLHQERDSATPSIVPAAQCNASDVDYRTMIDELRMQRRKLQDQLDRCKWGRLNILRGDELFELRVYGISARKKRELEAVLRDFATANGASNETLSWSQQSKATKRTKLENCDGGGGAKSGVMPPTLAGDNSRIDDSTSASTTSKTAHITTRQLLPDSSSLSAHTSLTTNCPEAPKGLYPRLDQTRTDQSPTFPNHSWPLGDGIMVPAPDVGGPRPNPPQNLEAASRAENLRREAMFLPRITQTVSGPGTLEDVTISPDTPSPQDSQVDKGPVRVQHSKRSRPAQQRAPYLHELDPDRVHNPSINMAYLRHLGLLHPESKAPEHQAGRLGLDEWIHINLLSNLAQLHLINVTPNFVRSAILRHSTALRLSSDGRKVRWCGLDEPSTSSDTSSDRCSPITSIGRNASDRHMSVLGTRRQLEAAEQATSSHSGMLPTASDTFHYEPMFFGKHTSRSSGWLDRQLLLPRDKAASNRANRTLECTGKRPGERKSFGHTIIYYRDAPFCFDLAGDRTDPSVVPESASGSASQENEQESPSNSDSNRTSQTKALRDGTAPALISETSPISMVSGIARPVHGLESGTAVDELHIGPAWTTGQQQHIVFTRLATCAVDGVVAADNFQIIVTTRRTLYGPLGSRNCEVASAQDWLPGGAAPLEHTASQRIAMPTVRIDYVSGLIRHFAPSAYPRPLADTTLIVRTA